jgi:hypothetical protein
MEPLEVDSPQVHDLLQLDPDSSQLAGTDAPDCVAPAVASCPWVVDECAQAPVRQIAVGVAGNAGRRRCQHVDASMSCHSRFCPRVDGGRSPLFLKYFITARTVVCY